MKKIWGGLMKPKLIMPTVEGVALISPPEKLEKRIKRIVDGKEIEYFPIYDFESEQIVNGFPVIRKFLTLLNDLQLTDFIELIDRNGEELEYYQDSDYKVVDKAIKETENFESMGSTAIYDIFEFFFSFYMKNYLPDSKIESEKHSNGELLKKIERLNEYRNNLAHLKKLHDLKCLDGSFLYLCLDTGFMVGNLNSGLQKIIDRKTDFENFSEGAGELFCGIVKKYNESIFNYGVDSFLDSFYNIFLHSILKNNGILDEKSLKVIVTSNTEQNKFILDYIKAIQPTQPGEQKTVPESLEEIADMFSYDFQEMDFTPLFKLGKGGSSNVYLTEQLVKGVERLCAVKIILNPEELEAISYYGAKEIARRGTEKTRDEEIKRMIGLGGIDELAKFNDFHTFEKNGKTYHAISLEYIKGWDIKELIQQGLDENTALKHSIEITKILRKIHNKGRVYGDLTSSNARYDIENDKIKFVDFLHVRPIDCPPEIIMKGSRLYHAPERGFKQQYYSSDGFSLGILLFEMFSKEKDIHPIEEMLDLEYPNLDNLLKKEYPHLERSEAVKHKIEDFLKQVYLIDKINNAHIYEEDTFNKREIEYLREKGYCSIIVSSNEGKTTFTPNIPDELLDLPKRYKKYIKEINKRYIKNRRVRKVIRKCTEINSDKRYQDIAEITKDLETIVKKKKIFKADLKEVVVGIGIVSLLFGGLYTFNDGFRKAFNKAWGIGKEKIEIIYDDDIRIIEYDNHENKDKIINRIESVNPDKTQVLPIEQKKLSVSVVKRGQAYSPNGCPDIQPVEWIVNLGYEQKIVLFNETGNIMNEIQIDTLEYGILKSHEISPKGDKLIFTTAVRDMDADLFYEFGILSEERKLFIMDLKDKTTQEINVKSLTNGKIEFVDYLNHSWSPNGNSILLDISEEKEESYYSCWGVLNSDSMSFINLSEIVGVNQIGSPVWSNDAKEILFIGNNGDNIYTFRLEDKSFKQSKYAYLKDDEKISHVCINENNVRLIETITDVQGLSLEGGAIYTIYVGGEKLFQNFYKSPGLSLLGTLEDRIIFVDDGLNIGKYFKSEFNDSHVSPPVTIPNIYDEDSPLYRYSGLDKKIEGIESIFRDDFSLSHDKKHISFSKHDRLFIYSFEDNKIREINYETDYMILDSSWTAGGKVKPKIFLSTSNKPLINGDKGTKSYTDNIVVELDMSGSHDRDGHITKYEIDYGDGNKEVLEHPKQTIEHIYKAGRYEIKVIGYDNDGNTDETNEKIVLYESRTYYISDDQNN